MNYNELRFIAKRPDFHPIIISYADNTHYVIAHVKAAKRYDIAKDRHGHTVCFKCLSEAKNALKKAGSTHTQLLMQTAYDEMIGQEETEDCIMEIDLV